MDSVSSRLSTLKTRRTRSTRSRQRKARFSVPIPAPDPPYWHLARIHLPHKPAIELEHNRTPAERKQTSAPRGFGFEPQLQACHGPIAEARVPRAKRSRLPFPRRPRSNNMTRGRACRKKTPAIPHLDAPAEKTHFVPGQPMCFGSSTMDSEPNFDPAGKSQPTRWSEGGSSAAASSRLVVSSGNPPRGYQNHRPSAVSSEIPIGSFSCKEQAGHLFDNK